MGVKWSKTFRVMLVLIVLALLLFGLLCYHGG